MSATVTNIRTSRPIVLRPFVPSPASSPAPAATSSLSDPEPTPVASVHISATWSVLDAAERAAAAGPRTWQREKAVRAASDAADMAAWVAQKAIRSGSVNDTYFSDVEEAIAAAGACKAAGMDLARAGEDDLAHALLRAADVMHVRVAGALERALP